MRVDFDVSICVTREEQRVARLAHPKKFGWQLHYGTWVRRYKTHAITALMFYRVHHYTRTGL